MTQKNSNLYNHVVKMFACAIFDISLRNYYKTQVYGIDLFICKIMNIKSTRCHSTMEGIYKTTHFPGTIIQEILSIAQ